MAPPGNAMWRIQGMPCGATWEGHVVPSGNAMWCHLGRPCGTTKESHVEPLDDAMWQHLANPHGGKIFWNFELNNLRVKLFLNS